MVTAGILLDDKSDIVIGHDGSRVYYDKKNPRTEVKIYRATPNEKYMTMIQSFRCDGCGSEFKSRDENGNPLPVGGVQGMFMEKQLDGKSVVPKSIDCDFCPECFEKIIGFILVLSDKNNK